jgi:hypothetical protein
MRKLTKAERCPTLAERLAHIGIVVIRSQPPILSYAQLIQIYASRPMDSPHEA